MSYPEECPSCGSPLIGAEIPADSRAMYVEPYVYSRVIAISNGNSFVAWKCPDCEHVWDRTEPPMLGLRKCTVIVDRSL